MPANLPASPSRNRFDALLFGGGTAGSILADFLAQAGLSVLLVDNPDLSRCSRVAAGLINPIGGKRLKLVWQADALIPFAFDYYAEMERRFHRRFFHPRPLARLFANEDERGAWQKRRDDPAYQRWTAPLDSLQLPEAFSGANGFAVPRAGYLDTEALLETLHQTLRACGALLSSTFNYNEIAVSADGVRFRDISARYAVFCEGHLATGNPWFNFAPFKPAKGIIGSIRLDGPANDAWINAPHPIAIHQGKFLVPRHDGRIAIGATYNWGDATDTPDAEGIRELETFLNQRFDDRWSWLDIRAGVRPATAGAYPLVGSHPEHANLFSFNGFGSKGSLQVPFFAQRLARQLAGEVSDLPAEVLPERFRKSPAAPKPVRWIATDIVQQRVTSFLAHGDIAIDATMGNGHDTAWLAEAVGEEGHVFAFDVQESAIDATRRRLLASKLDRRATLIARGHETMASSVPSELRGKVASVVFNLGYLPGGDPIIITQPETTIAALNASLELLRTGGLLCVTLYPFHHGGGAETTRVLEWIRGLPSETFASEVVPHPAANPRSPFPAFVTKRASAG